MVGQFQRNPFSSASVIPGAAFGVQLPAARRKTRAPRFISRLCRCVATLMTVRSSISDRKELERGLAAAVSSR
jgi:hypothetical protein